jgi:CRP-like cAMP-binding protein
MIAAASPRDALAGIHIFAGLRDEVLDTLAERCQARSVAAGDVIVEENVMGREMFLIGEGRIRIVGHRGSPGEMVLAELGGGEFFGEMSVIECTRRSASAVALTPGTLYALSNSDIHRLFKEWPDQFAILILNISRDLCRRLRAMNRLLAPGTGQVLRGERTGV